MCGIAAAFAYGGSGVDRAGLVQACDQMAPRGPDGSGLWLTPDGRAGLGHRRLSIIDLSEEGAQPMRSASGAHVIVFNGEIYNYQALRDELERDGHRFRSHSDTEVLLHLWATRGEAMLENVRGMFAFAIWDAERQGLFLARDPYGIKPLYIADDGKTIRVASQVKALLAGGGVDTEPDPAGHVGFFLWGHVPEPHTFYRGIRALPPGHSLWVDASGPRSERSFASVPEALAAAERAAETAPPCSAEEAQERLRGALVDSVRHHLVADVDVGVFLSSGRDSTTLAALASEVGGQLRTVTLGFTEYRGTADDEVPLAERVAAHYGARHDTVWIDRADFHDAFARFLASMDQPTLDGVNSYFVSRAAAQAGLKVALSGLGGTSSSAATRALRRSHVWSPWSGASRSLGASGPAYAPLRAPCSATSRRRSTRACWSTVPTSPGPTCCAVRCSCRGSSPTSSLTISYGRAGARSHRASGWKPR